MPYLIIYMREYLGFSDLEYSAVFAIAILVGGVINVVLGRISDKMEKSSLLYVAIIIFSLGLFAMYMANGMSHSFNILFFGLAGFAMITGYIFVAQLTGAIMRDFTPSEDTGKLQGVRMIFAVLIPMTVGPMIGNAINKASGNVLENAGADAMTTQYIPAPGIFLAAAGVAVLSIIFAFILTRVMNKKAALIGGVTAKGGPDED
jgi:MFS family permease